jgi:cobalt-zinc-cadmium efflux system outer membrane protein
VDYLAAVIGDEPSAVLALGERLGAMRAEARRARALENPLLGIEREAPGAGREQVTWGLTWRPPLDGRRGLRTAAAEAGVEAARLDLDVSFAELRADVRGAYAAWALAAEREAVVVEQLAQLRRLAGAARERARLGEESGLAARRLSLAAVEVEALAARAEAERIDSGAIALAWTSDVERDVRPERPPLPEAPRGGEPSEHPSLSARRHEVAEAELRLRLSRRFFLFPEITVGLQRVKEPSFDSEGLVLGGSWPLPLFDRQQPERIAAESRLRVSRARLELETRRVAALQSGAAAAYARLREGALAAADSLGMADRIVESAVVRFRAGESDATELIETMRSVMSARFAALDLYADALAAHRKLELAAARPSMTGAER